MTTKPARISLQATTRSVVVLAYTRLSADPQGRRIEHTTQRNDIADMLIREGLPAVSEWFSDTDRSASNADVVRDDWQRMLARIRSIDRNTVEVIVVAWDQSRLMRELGDPAMLADLIENRRGRLYSAMAGRIEVRQGGREALYFAGTVNKLASEATAARGSGGIRTAAMEGRPHGPVGYGWARMYPQEGPGRPKGVNVLNETEAAIVRELARRVLAGESLRAITDDLNRLGIPAPGAGSVRRRDKETRQPTTYASAEWVPAKVRQLLLRKSNVSIREHRRKDSEPGDPIPEYPADWPPILELDVYTQLVALLTAPERRQSSASRNVARHLLSGNVTCGICRQVLTTQNFSPNAKGEIRMVYRCRDSHVGKSVPRLDELVEQAVLALLSRKQVRQAVLSGDGGATRAAIEAAATLRAELKGLRQQHKQRVINFDEYVEFRNERQAELDAVLAELDRPRTDSVYADLVLAEDKAKTWKAYTLERKRAIVAATVKVVAHPTQRRGRSAFDTKAIDIEPRIPF